MSRLLYFELRLSKKDTTPIHSTSKPARFPSFPALPFLFFHDSLLVSGYIPFFFKKKEHRSRPMPPYPFPPLHCTSSSTTPSDLPMCLSPRLHRLYDHRDIAICARGKKSLVGPISENSSPTKKQAAAHRPLA